MKRFREKIKDLLSYSMGNIVWYDIIRVKRREKRVSTPVNEDGGRS